MEEKIRREKKEKAGVTFDGPSMARSAGFKPVGA